MLLLASLLLINGAVIVGSSWAGPAPGNITVMFLSSSRVTVSWGSCGEAVEKYDVTYRPTDARSVRYQPRHTFLSYRVVGTVAGNMDSVTLDHLQPNTQYQVVVTANVGGKKYRSRPVVFKTLEGVGPEEAHRITGAPPPPRPPRPRPSITTQRDYQGVYQVRGVEVGIVCLVLAVWVGAIALFFNRWGKIRMLLPYQPDYKESQLKVPGVGLPLHHSHCHHGSSPPCCCAAQGGCGCLDGCGGGCCMLVERCLKLLVPSTGEASFQHGRDCNCRFALLHRADTAA